MRSLEETIAGALRRESMAEAAVKQLEVEIEQLNRLVPFSNNEILCKSYLQFFKRSCNDFRCVFLGLSKRGGYKVR